MIENRRTGQFGIIGEDDQGRSDRRTAHRRSGRTSLLAASSREINRVPRSAGKSTAFMLELLSRATTIATPLAGDIRVLPPTVLWPGQCQGKAADREPSQQGGQRS